MYIVDHVNTLMYSLTSIMYEQVDLPAPSVVGGRVDGGTGGGGDVNPTVRVMIYITCVHDT